MFGVWLLAAIFIACNSPPPAVENYPADDHIEEAPAADSIAISQEVYDFTLAEVKLFVEDLNAIIKNKDYNAWKASLSDEFFSHISSPEFLANASEAAVLKSRKIVLKTPNDYFLQVVVPSRRDSRVDEIEFTATDRVKVFYVEERVRKNETSPSTTEVRRLRLYELVRVNDTWKIID